MCRDMISALNRNVFGWSYESPGAFGWLYDKSG